MKSTEVRASTCDIPLSRPVVMGELCTASQNSAVVELPAQEIDLIQRLSRNAVDLHGGLVHARDVPGLGLELAWAAVARYAVEEAG